MWNIEYHTSIMEKLIQLIAQQKTKTSKQKKVYRLQKVICTDYYTDTEALLIYILKFLLSASVKTHQDLMLPGWEMLHIQWLFHPQNLENMTFQEDL